MKLIHCADVHLDSRMTANLDTRRAKERQQEILHTFRKMIDYAEQNNICAILIAGDLFDTQNVLKTTRNVVIESVRTHSHIIFFYLRGNHDKNNFLTELEDLPENLKWFNEEWCSYALGENVKISGIELTEKNKESVYGSLELDSDSINIVMLHGQETETGNQDKTEIIDLRALRNRGIDYLALGHIHSFKEEVLDARGRYCYPGCLEGRGFDECGEHGFVVLDLQEEEKQIRSTFIPFAKRNLYMVEIDVTGLGSSQEMLEKIKKILTQGDYPESSLLKIILVGEVDVECDINLSYIKLGLESDFYFLKIENKTKLWIDMEQYTYDVSLKGEFVRTVKAKTDLTEKERTAIIRYGLQALRGEEVQD